MKQLLQNLANGATTVADVPCPRTGRGRLLIRITTSLVSAGTERMYQTILARIADQVPDDDPKTLYSSC